MVSSLPENWAYRTNGNQMLDLRGLCVSDAGAKIVAANAVNCALDMSLNQITDAGAAALANARAMFNTLILEHNNIGDDGAIALAEQCGIRTLSLGYNVLGDRGVVALAGQSHLACLNLSGLRITNRAAAALAQNTTLVKLELNSVRIEIDGLAVFSSNNTLKHLNLTGVGLNYETELELIRWTEGRAAAGSPVYIEGPDLSFTEMSRKYQKRFTSWVERNDVVSTSFGRF